MKENKDFLFYKTQMPKTMRSMYDYDTMLDKVIHKVSNNVELDINENLLLLNFLLDLKLFRKYYGQQEEI